ncbi:MAG: LptE family protein [Candidatus Eisenbacteria bacterium]
MIAVLARRASPHRPRVLPLALLMVALAGAGGCAYTTSTAALPPHVRTIAIPTFQNETTEYAIEQSITQTVIDRFVADNHLKVVDEKSADYVVRGTLKGYRNVVFGFNTAENAQEYRVTIVVSVTVKDAVKNREVWSDASLSRYANYFVVAVPGSPAKTEFDGRADAISKIADEILARTVQGW